MNFKLGITRKHVLLLVSAGICNCLVYNGGRFISRGMEHHSMAVTLDMQIPFLPWTVLIYWGCYLYWLANYVIGVRFDKGNGQQFIGAHFIGEIVCFLIFVLFPTTMVRPVEAGSGIGSQMLALTYMFDALDNLFPSIHCFVSWLCWVGVRNNKHIPKWYQYISLLIAVSVCVSTLTVKQHVLADVPAGIILAELSYVAAGILDRRNQRTETGHKYLKNRSEVFVYNKSE